MQFFFSLLFLLNFFSLKADTLVDVKVPEGTTLDVISKKYLIKPEFINEVYKYNPELPEDKKIPIGIKTIKIPKKILKKKIGDVVFFKPLAMYRKRNSLNWEKLSLDKRLFPGDGIMTWDGGTIKISFLVGGSLLVSTDSLIFLKEEEKKKPVASFLAGNINVEDVKVVSHGVELKPEENSEYVVNTSAKKDVRLSVRKGKVSVTAKNKTVVVKEGYKTEVKFGKAPELPTPLPPGVSDIHKLRDLKKGEKYHLQIALDKEFKKIVVDKYILSKEDVEKERTSLEPGLYYLRVALFTADGFESKWSEFVYFVKGPEAKDPLKIEEIKKISNDSLEVRGYYPEITSVVVNGYPGEILEGDRFVCKFKIGEEKFFTMIINSKFGVFLKKFKKSPSGIWIPIEK